MNNIWLKISYFFLSNKFYFRKWWVIILVAFDIFVVIFALTNVIVYIISVPRETKLMIDMAQSPLDYRSIRENNVPSPLDIIDAKAIKIADGKYDIVTQVKNVNSQWAAEAVHYKFKIGGEESELKTDFILPNSEKYLTYLNADAPSANEALNASLVIEDVDWLRVDNAAQLPPIDFAFKNVQYSFSSSEESVYWVTADVINQGYAGFWETKFAVLLYRSDLLIGIGHAYFSSFDSGAEKSLYVQWDNVAGTVTNVEILPDIDVLHDDNII